MRPLRRYDRPLSKRDIFLDMAKGLAIILVVLGHTLQSQGIDFENSLPAHAIYCFHMAFFIFLSGAVTGLKVPVFRDSTLGARARFRIAAKAIGRATVRLLVPYISWTLISWYLDRQAEFTLSQWMETVLRQPDYSLWFLLLVFYCLCVWHLWGALIGLLGTYLPAGLHRSWKNILTNDFIVVGGMGLFVYGLLYAVGASGQFGVAFLKQYLAFFILGILYARYPQYRLQRYWRLLPYIVYLSLFPYWLRAEPGKVSVELSHYMPMPAANYGFRIILAVAGIFMTLDVVSLILKLRSKILNQILAYFGVASLGIYAVHFHIPGYPPFVILLLLSVAAYALLLRLPVVRVVLLGETAGKSASWPIRLGNP